MREASFIFQPKEMGGLSPFDVLPLNTRGWKFLYGMMPDNSGGYVRSRRMSVAGTGGQLVKLWNNGVFVDTGSEFLSVSESVAVAIPGGIAGPWAVADFGDWRLISGLTGMAVFDDLTEAYTFYPDAYFSSTAAMDGRLFCATPSAVWAQDWTDAVALLAGDNAEGKAVESRASAMVIWTGVGGWRGVDRDWIIDPTKLTAEIFENRLEPGFAGFAYVPGATRVESLVVMGHRLLVFADNGVWELTQNPDVGMALAQICRIGCYSRVAVATSDNRAVWLGKDLAFWGVDGDSAATRLGFCATAGPMLAENPLLSYDPIHDEFWASSSDGYAFIVSSDGQVSQSDQAIRNILAKDGEIIASGAEPADQFIMGTGPTDLGMAEGFKRITWVTVSGCGFTDLQVKVDTRPQAGGGNWTQGKWVSSNREGAAYVGTSGVQFQITIKGLHDSGGAQIGNITLRYQSEDRRFVRGI